jgi:hypothetical protein
VEYSGTREWLFVLGQTSAGSEHWLWKGSSIQFGRWGGAQIETPYDITSCTWLATTYDSSTSTYTLYCDGAYAASHLVF